MALQKLSLGEAEVNGSGILAPTDPVLPFAHRLQAVLCQGECSAKSLLCFLRATAAKLYFPQCGVENLFQIVVRHLQNLALHMGQAVQGGIRFSLARLQLCGSDIALNPVVPGRLGSRGKGVEASGLRVLLLGDLGLMHGGGRVARRIVGRCSQRQVLTGVNQSYCFMQNGKLEIRPGGGIGAVDRLRVQAVAAHVRKLA